MCSRLRGIRPARLTTFWKSTIFHIEQVNWYEDWQRWCLKWNGSKSCSKNVYRNSELATHIHSFINVWTCEKLRCSNIFYWMVVSSIKCTAYALQHHKSRQTLNIQHKKKTITKTRHIHKQYRWYYDVKRPETTNILWKFKYKLYFKHWTKTTKNKKKWKKIHWNNLVSLARFG